MIRFIYFNLCKPLLYSNCWTRHCASFLMNGKQKWIVIECNKIDISSLNDTLPMIGGFVDRQICLKSCVVLEHVASR